MRPVHLVALIVLASPAAATWSVHGDTEPDTAYDLAGYAFLEPDVDPDPTVRKVYFNVVTDANDVVMVNPNAARTGSRLSTPTPAPVAYLGVWKDCNGDGMVGEAQTLLLQYRLELLADRTVCPDSSPHVAGGWVYEFLWLGDFPSSYPRPGTLGANGTRVWGDNGLPGETLGVSCAIYPLPRGTTGSTGGLLAYLDCQDERGLTSTVNSVDAAAGLGLGFEDPASPQTSGSPLNQPVPLHPFDAPQNPEGSRRGSMEYGSGQSRFTVWDCSARGTAVYDPTGAGTTPLPEQKPLPPSISASDGMLLHVPAVSPSVSAEGSLVDAAVVAATGPTASAFAREGCGDRQMVDGYVNIARNNLPHRTFVEGDEGGQTVRPHRWTDHWFRFVYGSVGQTIVPITVPAAVPVVGGTKTPRVELPPPGIPWNLGLDPLVGAATWQPQRYTATGPRWIAGEATSAEDAETPLVTRDTLAPAGARYRAFYADIPDTASVTLTLPGAGGRYGLEWCGAGSLEVVRGFDCDGSRWWSPAHGAPPEPPITGGARPGSLYDVRDIDCQDQQVAPGIYASLTQEACR